MKYFVIFSVLVFLVFNSATSFIWAEPQGISVSEGPQPIPSGIKKIPLPPDISKTMRDICYNMGENGFSKDQKQFWQTLHLKLISITPEFKSVNGKISSVVIDRAASSASCPPGTTMNGTFTSVNEKKHKFQLEFDGNSFRYQINGIFPPQYENLIESPLKQFKSGIESDKIKCKESLHLIRKIDGSPACIKPENHAKLIMRGWALMKMYIPGEIPEGIEIPKNVNPIEFEKAASQSKFYGLRPETILSVTDYAYKSWMTLEMIPENEYQVREGYRKPSPPNPILEFTQDELHQKVKAMIEEMWKVGGYKPSRYNHNIQEKEINLNSTYLDHQSINDWLEKNHQKQFGGNVDATGFTNYFKYDDHIYSLGWGVGD